MATHTKVNLRDASNRNDYPLVNHWAGSKFSQTRIPSV